MSDLRASLVAIGCLLRSLPLFFCASPRTPLRALGIIALDILHVLRHSRPLPRTTIRSLALFLDFEGCANAACDHKDLCQSEYQAIRQQLEAAGLRSRIEEYLGRLRELERRRPPVCGDRRCFDEVRSYREAVARLALSTAASIAQREERREPDVRPAPGDGDIDTLFRILMQCQIIDDVLDYTEDLAASLPSFLTACASLSQAAELTAQAARSYSVTRGRASGRSVLPFRLSLGVVTTVTILVVRVAHWRHRRDEVAHAMPIER